MLTSREHSNKKESNSSTICARLRLVECIKDTYLYIGLFSFSVNRNGAAQTEIPFKTECNHS